MEIDSKMNLIKNIRYRKYKKLLDGKEEIVL